MAKHLNPNFLQTYLIKYVFKKEYSNMILLYMRVEYEPILIPKTGLLSLQSFPVCNSYCKQKWLAKWEIMLYICVITF